MHKALSKYIEGQWLSGSKVGVQTELAASPTEQHVSLEEQLADRLLFFRHGIWE